MSDLPPQRELPLPEQRERTVRALCGHYAEDRLDTAEFERRLDLAYAAAAPADLAGLLADLPALRAPAPARSPAAAAPRDAVAGRRFGFVVAIMGGIERAGRWRPSPHTIVTALMGGAELDFRDVELPPGETHVTIVALMGGVDLIVPPEMIVDTGGVALMGGFDHASGAPAVRDPDAAILKVNGLAVMGGVSISVRLPGESAGDARKRLKEERRLRRLRHPG